MRVQAGMDGTVFDPGLSKIFKKFTPMDKQLALSDKLEGIIKGRTRKCFYY